jgi:hypothetical protein
MAKFFDKEQPFSIGSPEYTSYNRLFINEANVVYCIAAGPLKLETLLAIQIQDGKSESAVLDAIEDTEEFNPDEISAPESIIYQVHDEKSGTSISIEGFYHAPTVNFDCKKLKTLFSLTMPLQSLR